MTAATEERPTRSLKRRRTTNASPPPSRPSPSKRQYLGPCHLLNLPQELILRILCFLSPPSLLKLSLTNHKIYSLAADPQVWKALFYKRFVVPRLSERHRQHKHLVQRSSTSAVRNGNGNREVPLSLAKEWNLWLDDYILLQKEREIVRDVARTREEVLQEEQVRELEMSGPITTRRKIGMDWKGKYRLRHNWYRGSSSKGRLRVCDAGSGLLSTGDVSEEARRCFGMSRYHNGYLFTIDYRGLTVRSTNPSYDRRPELVYNLDLTHPYSGQDWISCITLDETLHTNTTHILQGDHGIDIVLGTGLGQVLILNYSPSSHTVIQRTKTCAREASSAIRYMAYARPYLVFITEDEELYLYSYHASMSFPREKQYTMPLLVTRLDTDWNAMSGLGLCLSIRLAEENDDGNGSNHVDASRKDEMDGIMESRSQGYVVAIVKEYQTLYSEGRVDIQELHIDSRTNKIFLSRVSTYDDAGVTMPSYSCYVPCSSISYRHPYVLTSHKNNTLTLYTVNSPSVSPPSALLHKISTTMPTSESSPQTSTSSTSDPISNTNYNLNPRPLTISPGYSMWGHCASVTSVYISSKRAISIDSMGEIRIWNFWRNISGLMQRSVLVKGTSPSDPDAVRREWEVIGFGEEQIAVGWRSIKKEDAGDGGEGWVDVYDFS